MSQSALPPILLEHEFPHMRRVGMEMLRELTPEEWSMPTAVPGWDVHDVALHILGGLLANVSRRRDGHGGNFGEFAPDLPDLDDFDRLVRTLNGWNETWVMAARRLSPRLTVDLIDFAAQQLEDYFLTVDLWAMGDPIGWTGSEPAPVWLDVAREYTEVWSHLAQIREGTGRDLIDSPHLFAPVVATFLHGVPHALRGIERPVGTTLDLRIRGDAGGEWRVVRKESGWQLTDMTGSGPGSADGRATAVVEVDQAVVWRLETKGMNAEDARGAVVFEGDRDLAEGFLRLLAILA